MTIKGLVFDFDGLIIDTELPIFQSWQDIYQLNGIELTLREWAVVIGSSNEMFEPMDELEKRVNHPLFREDIKEMQRLKMMEHILQQPILPGIEDYLRQSKELGLGISIASSSPRYWVEGHLSRLGLINYFDTIFTQEDVLKVKPDPELYQQAVSGMHLNPEDVIALEDSTNGIVSAKLAGLHCVAVPNTLTRSLDLTKADLVLTSLADLPLLKLLDHFNKIYATRNKAN
jgi:HAD superfamily hydrolase (TIGR01509 family)